MALQPSLSPLIIAGHPNAPNTLEFFCKSIHRPYSLCLRLTHSPPVDYVCPFSAKSVIAIDQVLKPLFDSGEYAGKVKIIFRNQVQPWHVSSMLTHEAALAVSDTSTVNV